MQSSKTKNVLHFPARTDSMCSEETARKIVLSRHEMDPKRMLEDEAEKPLDDDEDQ